jgi:microcystin degradation protein MlrC
VDEWRDAAHEVGGFLETLGSDAVPLLMAWATPSGPVTDDLFEEVTTQLIQGLKRERPDGLLLALHGAMVAESHPDADGDVMARVRSALGRDFPIAVTLDLHGNLSPQLIDLADVAVAYRTCPHLDQRECGRRAATLLQRQLRGEIRPTMAMAKPPMLINIMAHDTSRDPLRPFMDDCRSTERKPGVLAVSLLPGFPWADVPHMGPSIVVAADGDAALARREADRLAGALWEARERFTPHLPGPAEAVTQALRAERTPVVLVDTGDNVGGGSAGDGTILLTELLRQGATGVTVCLYEPEAVQLCAAAGVGGVVKTAVGGKVDRLHGEPSPVRGVVQLLHDGNYVEEAARHGGRRRNAMGATALLALPGDNQLVLTTQRHPPFSLGALTCLGIEPGRRRVLVVKAAIAYRAAYEPIARTIIEVETPGLTAINPRRPKPEPEA